MPTQQGGRNDPCPCGSGRKFKACCLRGDASPHQVPAATDHRPEVGQRRWGVHGSVSPHTSCQSERCRPIKRIPVHYTYPEPFGVAECVYCFPADRLTILADGSVIRAEWLQAGMWFRMEDGGLGTVTAVEPPKVW